MQIITHKALNRIFRLGQVSIYETYKRGDIAIHLNAEDVSQFLRGLLYYSVEGYMGEEFLDSCKVWADYIEDNPDDAKVITAIDWLSKEVNWHAHSIALTLMLEESYVLAFQAAAMAINKKVEFKMNGDIFRHNLYLNMRHQKSLEWAKGVLNWF